MHSRLIAISLVALLLSGCASVPNPLAGAAPVATANAAPAAASAPTQPAATDPRLPILTKAGVGTLTASAVSGYMDQQEAELRTQLQATGLSVTRAGSQILLTLPADALFTGGGAAVNPDAKETLTSIGVVLKHFGKTVIDVYGYTDAQSPGGKDVSQRRAVAIGTALAGQGVDQRRFYIEGRGAANPIASNATATGRALNRRVAIQISPLT
jgi:outer membrane protein OmpA-like peptidoglycan-associated protein